MIVSIVICDNNYEKYTCTYTSKNVMNCASNRLNKMICTKENITSSFLKIKCYTKNETVIGDCDILYGEQLFCKMEIMDKPAYYIYIFIIYSTSKIMFILLLTFVIITIPILVIISKLCTNKYTTYTPIT